MTPYDTFPTTWAGRPPAMPEGDYYVWKMFQPWFATQWDTVAYDVELRDGPWPIIDTTPDMRAMWARNTARRVDAVAFARNVGALMEVRHAAAWQSYGQLLGYADLWAKTYTDILIGSLWLVTDSIPPDIAAVANGSGIFIWTPDGVQAPMSPRGIYPPGATITNASHRV